MSAKNSVNSFNVLIGIESLPYNQVRAYHCPYIHIASYHGGSMVAAVDCGDVAVIEPPWYDGSTKDRVGMCGGVGMQCITF